MKKRKNKKLLNWIKKHKKTAINSLICLLIASIAFSKIQLPNLPDSYFKNRTVKISSATGIMCSGEQVRAPSGKDYILTAAHCKSIAINGEVEVTPEGSLKPLVRKVLIEDDTSDLLLIEGLPNLRGLDLSYKISTGDHVRTYTHGGGYPTYRTDGIAIGEEKISIGIGMVSNAEEQLKCRGKKYSIQGDYSMFGSIGMCMITVTEMSSTAYIMPGSSGGMVIGDDDKLVGVVSAYGERVSEFVTLKDIRSFLSDK